MSRYDAQTNEVKEVQLESDIQRVFWSRITAAPGGEVGLEIITKYVGNGAEMKIELSDHSGKNHGKLTEKLVGNRHQVYVRIPENARDALYADVKLSKHGLKATSPALLLVPLLEITNVRWSASEARRGDVLTLSAEVDGVPDGTAVDITIFEHDADGAHELVTRISDLLENGKVEAEWEFEFHADNDDIATEEDSATGYAGPEYFFRVTVHGVSVDSKILTFKDWIEFEILDGAGIPYTEERYVLRLADGSSRKGTLDKQGRAREEDLPPGPIRVVLDGETVAYRSLSSGDQASEAGDGVAVGTGERRELTLAPLKVSTIEVEDALFNTNSAVLLPAHSATYGDGGQAEGNTGIGVIHAALRFFAAYPGKKLLIVGHTDTSGEIRYNFRLSKLRSETALALLTGDRDTFSDVCSKKHRIADVQQILKSIQAAVNWSCDPGSVDDLLGPMTQGALQRFQEAYNDRRDELGIKSPDISVQAISGGSLNRESWGAFFDMYDWQLAGLLGCSIDELSTWRERVKFADDGCKVLGCGESFPIEEAHLDDYRSRENRRIEFLFFDEDEVIDFECLEERDTVYTIEECPAYNPARYERVFLDPQEEILAWVELQTVDDIGHYVSDVDLILRHRDGLIDDIEAKTDENGYWSRGNVPSGIYDVLMPDGRPAITRAGEVEQSAVLDTKIARSTITSIVVPSEIPDEDRLEHQQQEEIYGRSSKHADEVSEGRGGEDRPTRRASFYATDNLSLAAGWTDDGQRCNEEKLLEHLHTWLGDYHPSSRRRGYYVHLLEERKLRVYVSPDGQAGPPQLKEDFELEADIEGAIGAYASFEYDGELFRDMNARVSGLRVEGREAEVVPIAEVIHDGDRERFTALMTELRGKVEILYKMPTATQLVWLGVVGGTGRFENYGRIAEVNEHVHARNLAMAETIHYGYSARLQNYIDNVEEAPSADVIRALGPPPEPYTFPQPVGSSYQQYRDLLTTLDTSSYHAWLAISDRLNTLAGRIPDGTMFFRVKFALKENVSYGDASPYSEVKTEWNFDISEHGVFRKHDTTLTAGAQFEAGKGPRTFGAGVNREMSLESGDEKTTVNAKFGKWGIEADDSGGQKVTGPYGLSSEGNLRMGQMGFGTTLSTHDLFKLLRKRRGEKVADDAFKNVPNAELYVGLHFQGLRQENVLAVVSNAPGFFERRSLKNLLAPGTQWSDLDFDERAHLDTLGWSRETWDRKHLMAYSDFPSSARESPHKLSSAEQIAIVHLGITFDTWTGIWRRIAGN